MKDSARIICAWATRRFGEELGKVKQRKDLHGENTVERCVPERLWQ
jgi:hypothetical protein